MIPADETFDGTWPFNPHFSSAAGFRQHYVDEGPIEVVDFTEWTLFYMRLSGRRIPGRPD